MHLYKVIDKEAGKVDLISLSKGPNGEEAFEVRGTVTFKDPKVWKDNISHWRDIGWVEFLGENATYEVDYNSNNSGGSFWLTTKNWKDLEAAGWDVEVHTDPYYTKQECYATNASKTFPNRYRGEALELARAEFESVTGEHSRAIGCTCCGPPHNFY